MRSDNEVLRVASGITRAWKSSPGNGIRPSGLAGAVLLQARPAAARASSRMAKIGTKQATCSCLSLIFELQSQRPKWRDIRILASSDRVGYE